MQSIRELDVAELESIVGGIYVIENPPIYQPSPPPWVPVNPCPWQPEG